MAKEQVRMPSSTAGITQYFSEEHTKFRIKATHVIALIIFVAVLMILLHVVGSGMFG